ncbi:ATP-dependent DNA ligase [candidate division KSB1 bacterium]|nr:ATP-dependent DNA ligase [candidate division KSB1 bacterium]
MSDSITINGHRIELSKLDKEFYGDQHITKGDVIDYYTEIAEIMLPYLKDRPVSMHRFPDGIEGKNFYQKERPDYFPDWISGIDIKLRKGGKINMVLCNSAATLVYLADQANLVYHVWLSRQDRLNEPDRIVFDLDPSDGDNERVRRAALAVHDFFSAMGLKTLVMTSGSKGYHVHIPIRRGHEFDEIRKQARRAATLMAKQHADLLTTEQRKEKRGKKIFIDTARNAFGQTSIVPYSLRARPGAPVATPLEWQELQDKRVEPQEYTLNTIQKRLSQKKDPWQNADLQSVKKLQKGLDDLGD